MTVLRLFFAIVIISTLSACGSTARVTSPSTGPDINEALYTPNGEKYRIAVQDFTFKAARGGGKIGQGMTDMMVSALFNTNKFIVLEREELDAVIAEQDLANSGRFSERTAAPIGQLEGAELLVRGSITEFEPKCSGASLILISTNQACVTMNLRIIDAKTGRIANATTVEATSSNNGVGLIFTTDKLPIGLGAYSNTPMEKALRNAIETAVKHIASTKI